MLNAFKTSESILPNSLAFSFTIVGYALGVFMLFSGSWFINVAGVLVTAQALIISAYLLHEFSHWSIFKTPNTNRRWGVLMTWINGSCYSTFEEIRNKHMHHHVDRADVLTFNVQHLMRDMPSFTRNTIKALEWAYIPALEILIHFLVIVLPFLRPEWHHKRPRLLAILLIRLPLLALMALVSIKAWLLYLLAYGIMLTALRFADAFQHTYDVFLESILAQTGGKIADAKLRDRAYEQANTFSNLTSLQYPWLNLIFLNFPYHNAHHEKPVAPWFQLPQLHQQLFGDSPLLPVIPMSKLLLAYHRHRVKRLQSDDYGVLTNDNANAFIGAAGVSFLTAL
ncbi:MAG: fatty acid desaturase [Bdellovibrio sp.]|nr:fatty acid desaturase [Methylotenera sp.]